MTQHDDLAYLGHMLETARDAVASLTGVTYKQFASDQNLRFALAHRVQIIGEAARRVSEETRQAFDLPWIQIIGMRHKITHDYMGIDFDLVWSTAVNDLPQLIATLERSLPDEPVVTPERS